MMESKENAFRFLIFFISITGFLLPYSEQYGSGAPPKACMTMLPLHGITVPQSSSPPYAVKTNNPQVRQGTKITITLYSPINTAIRGFLIQARSVQEPDKILGSWSNIPPKTQYKNCSYPLDSVTHTSTDVKSNLQFTWNAPANFLGSVIFRATVAEQYDQYWAKIDSTLVEVVTPNTPIAESETNDNNIQLTTDNQISIETTKEPLIPQREAFYDGCGTSKLCFGYPSACIEKENCEAVTSVNVKGDKYIFELLGDRSLAYVGVGLSSDKLMGDDSAMECIQKNGKVSMYTSWTFPKVDPYVSRENVSQSIIQPLETSFKNGKIYCRFTRESLSIIMRNTFDLIKDRYYLLLVAGSNLKENSVGFHDRVFVSTDSKVSLAEIKQIAGASKLLLRLHGAFLVIAWIGTASCGILLARYYRQTWVGKQLGGKDLWFAWHRIFMVTTWLLTMAAFIIILIELGGWGGTGDNPHAIIGIVTIILCFLQPVGAYFRPHPNTPKRPIFNWVHWFFGNAAHILGIVTIFFAVYLRKAELPGWMAYVLVGFVAFHVIMHIILSITTCISDGRISNGRVNTFPMKDLMTNTRHTSSNDRKVDAPHSGFRKIILATYFVINILFVIILVCLIALAPIEELYKSVTEAISGENSKNGN